MKNVNYLLRTLVLGAFAVVLLLSYFKLTGMAKEHRTELAARDKQIDELGAEIVVKTRRIDDLEVVVADQAEQIQNLEAALSYLKVDHRLARIEVLEQGPATAGASEVHTTLKFQEMGADGLPLGPPAIITLLGRVAYLDALVIKFEDDYIEKGDFLRGTSICLFRRLFGEYQQPNEGFPIDAVGSRPRAYAAESADPRADAIEEELWSRFWDYANDRDLAGLMGVRAVQGEAPYMELRPGKAYRVLLRASGGLSILPEN